MQPFLLRFFWGVLIFSLAACRQGVDRPPEQPLPAASSPEPAQPAGPENILSPTDPGPTARLPQTGATPPAREWVCASGELPPAAESARVEMGPGPGIPASPASGERLSIAAVVYSRDCQPLAGLTINLWQTDPQGIYGPGHGTNNMQCCYYMARATTDENGRFDLLTVKPGAYQGEASPPPAHIHVEIVPPGGQNWQTEIVFAGDPNLPGNLPPRNMPQGMIAISLEEQSLPDGLMLFGEAEIITPLGAP